MNLRIGKYQLTCTDPEFVSLGGTKPNGAHLFSNLNEGGRKSEGPSLFLDLFLKVKKPIFFLILVTGMYRGVCSRKQNLDI